MMSAGPFNNRSFTPFVVYAIIAANLAVFAYQLTLNDSSGLIFTLRNAVVPRAFFEPVWGIYNGIKPSDYWPFITSTFMHGGYLHILLNMFALFTFGPALERRFGRIQFIAFYLICGVAAGALHAYLNKQSSSPLVGASGAIAGAVAAYATLYPRQKLFVFPIPIAVPMWFLAIAFLSLQVYQVVQEMANPLEGGGIAWWAHIGGFVAGLVLLPLFLLLKPRNSAAGVRGGEASETRATSEKGPWG
ncbi:MAG: rhomboid family intramembrane serine protease [Hyphomicrobiales bacterium]|nr:rhomboid family intramembrane serine protease [Hyphomicrobiales bacterium]